MATPRPRPAPRRRTALASLPPPAAPMLATLVAEPFDDPAWLFEPKFDGLRVHVRFDGETLTLLSRTGQPQEAAFPDVRDALHHALAAPAVLDGEVVCFDTEGRTSFRALRQRFHLKGEAEVAERARPFPASVYLFDVLWLDGRDLTGLPLRRRQEALRGAVHWSERVRRTEAVPEKGKAFFRSACRRGEEGVIGKRADSPYVPGRSPDWVKVRCVRRQEFVIGGFTDPRRARVGLGALLAGHHDDEGRLAYAGKVGTGYTRETLLDLRQRLGEREANEACAGIRALGRQALAVRADVSLAREVTRLVREVERGLGPVDVLVNNAGVTRPQPLEQITEADWDELLAVNLKSVFLVTQAVLHGKALASGSDDGTIKLWAVGGGR
jgi:bifunctional non-homologous end joining protein LigD